MVLQKRVVDNFTQKNKNKAFDIGIIDTIVEIVDELVFLFRDICELPLSEAVRVANNPTLFQKLRLKLKVRRTLGWQKYKAHGDDIVDSILEAGATATEDDFRKTYEQ